LLGCWHFCYRAFESFANIPVVATIVAAPSTGSA